MLPKPTAQHQFALSPIGSPRPPICDETEKQRGRARAPLLQATDVDPPATEGCQRRRSICLQLTLVKLAGAFQNISREKRQVCIDWNRQNPAQNTGSAGIENLGSFPLYRELSIWEVFPLSDQTFSKLIYMSSQYAAFNRCCPLPSGCIASCAAIDFAQRTTAVPAQLLHD